MTSEGSRTKAIRHLVSNLERGPLPQRLSHERFDQSHELFERSSNQQRLILAWLTELIETRFTSCDPMKILSVGCGSGILDRPLMECIASSSGRIEYTGVDPNGVACSRFRRYFENLELPNVELELIEEGVESLIPIEKYDLIKVVHSLYYVDDPAKTLEQLLQMLAPGGVVAIVQAPFAELNQLSKCFWRHHEADGIWFSDCLTDHLIEREVSFSRHRINAEVDLTNCFVAGSPEGEMLLDFIMQSDCLEIDQEVLELCLSYLHDISSSQNDRVMTPHPTDAVVIERP